MGDGRAHIGIAELGQHRTIAVGNQGVDNTLRVNHHFDKIRCHAKQPAGFDQLQALVHHGG